MSQVTPGQDLSPPDADYLRRTTTLNGTPTPDCLSPGDVHRHARSLLQNRSPLGFHSVEGLNQLRSSHDLRAWRGRMRTPSRSGPASLRLCDLDNALRVVLSRNLLAG